MKKNKTYPAGLRLWHWLTVLIIAGVVATAFLPGTFLNINMTGRQAREVLAGRQVQISEEQSFAIGRALADNAWRVHQYLGYALVALFIFRLVLEATGRSGRRLFPPVRRTIPGTIPPPGRVVRRIYLLFYLVLAIAVVTGICLSLVVWYPELRYYRSIRILHEMTMYFVLVFTIVHLVGVLRAERGEKTKGIVSGMINGSV
jgi:Ni/Fe-hydrogenase 1 B-type cytochrome subunit